MRDVFRVLSNCERRRTRVRSGKQRKSSLEPLESRQLLAANVVISESFYQMLDNLRRIHVAECPSRSRTHVRCFLFQRFAEHIKSALVFDKRHVLDRRAPHSWGYRALGCREPRHNRRRP